MSSRSPVEAMTPGLRPSRRRTATAAFVVVIFAVVACGADDDSADDDVGSDHAYVLAACEAQNQFLEAISSSPSGGGDLTEEERIGAFGEAVQAERQAVREMRPPADVVEYHQELLAGLDRLIEVIDAGDISALDSFSSNAAEALSESTRSRLVALADETEECRGLGAQLFESDD
jgi:hypothetical protein